MISRREWLRITAGGLALGTAGATSLLALAPAKEATVYKDANCGCCKKWIEYMQQNGWTVKAIDVPDVGVYKKKYGVPASLVSCHTAIVTGGYVVEGHVPVELINRFVTVRPKDFVGLAVPGMPNGSPGMETGRKDKYQVLAFNKAGETKIFGSY